MHTFPEAYGRALSGMRSRKCIIGTGTIRIRVAGVSKSGNMGGGYSLKFISNNRHGNRGNLD